jgi:hypothetical protein
MKAVENEVASVHALHTPTFAKTSMFAISLFSKLAARPPSHVMTSDAVSTEKVCELLSYKNGWFVCVPVTNKNVSFPPVRKVREDDPNL